MHRKHFIGSLFPLGLSLKTAFSPSENHVQPPFLQKGDLIGITSPAGYISLEDIQPAISQMKQWGFQVKIGKSIGQRDYTFGGTDEQRLCDLQDMLDDAAVKAIMCARGGYGAVRIVDRLSFKEFVRHPKWLIGFSDITVLISHIVSNYGIGCIHAKMCNSFPADLSTAEPVQLQSLDSIKKALTGEFLQYTTDYNAANRNGVAQGILTGGNCKVIESLSGTKSDLFTHNRILFLEDTGEYLYSIDRMFWNLKRTGKLRHLKGLIIGNFKVKPDDIGEEFGKSLQEIILEKVTEYNYPVCFDFPVGHQKNNVALRCGVTCKLEVNGSAVLSTVT